MGTYIVGEFHLYEINSPISQSSDLLMIEISFLLGNFLISRCLSLEDMLRAVAKWLGRWIHNPEVAGPRSQWLLL